MVINIRLKKGNGKVDVGERSAGNTGKNAGLNAGLNAGSKPGKIPVGSGNSHDRPVMHSNLTDLHCNLVKIRISERSTSGNST
jgi:hypothetical protein